MISVIIPLMPIEPYDKMHKDVVMALKNQHAQRIAGKRHWKTSENLRGLYKETVKDLQEMGYWP